MSNPGSLLPARPLTPEDERKIAAYDRARSRVKIEGNTRAEYVLRLERLEQALERLRNPMGEPKTEEAVLVQIEVAKIASEALGYVE